MSVEVQAKAARRVLDGFPWDDEAAGDRVMAEARDYEAGIPEVLLRQAGRCPEQTAYGHKGVTSVEFCGRKAKRDNWFGHCPRHEREGTEEHGVGYWVARDRAVQDVSASVRGFHQAADESKLLGDSGGSHLAPRCSADCDRARGHDGQHRSLASVTTPTQERSMTTTTTEQSAPRTRDWGTPSPTARAGGMGGGGARTGAAAVGVQGDIGSAPAAIDTWTNLVSLYEGIEQAVRAEVAEVAAMVDNSGPYAVGGESEVLASFNEALNRVRQWRAQAESVLDRLHKEYDGPIAAAVAKHAAAHAPMQDGASA